MLPLHHTHIKIGPSPRNRIWNLPSLGGGIELRKFANVILSIIISMEKKDTYDWVKIQEFYDEGNTWFKVSKKFNVSLATISTAKKEGHFRSRSKSESLKLYNKNQPKRVTSKDTKLKISKARKKFLLDNPDKVPYIMNHYSKGDSYPERYFTKCLKDSEFIKKYRLSTYELDFADTEKMIDLEIDGQQHFVDPKIVESDKRRNKFLTDCGWRIYRVNWSAFMKLKKSDKDKVVDIIKNDLKINHDSLIYITGITCPDAFDKYKNYGKLPPKKCLDCEKIIKQESTRCNSCCVRSRPKKLVTTKEELSKFISSNLTMVKIGEHFGVTCNAIRRRCDLLGIDYRNRK